MFEPDFLARFTTHLKEALQKALGFSVHSGRQLVEPGDLIVGLLHEKGAIGAGILMKTGITLLAVELPDVRAFIANAGASLDQLKEQISQILTSTSKFPDLAVPNAGLDGEPETPSAPRTPPMGRGRMAPALEAFGT